MEVLLTEDNLNENFCTHCGAEIPSARAGSHFCCAGCEFVWNSIKGLGLSNYYDLLKREDQRALKPTTTAQSFGFMNDPTFLAAYTTKKSDEITECSFLLEGIHCAACIWLLEKLPTLINGIYLARVEFGSGKLTVTFNEKNVKISEIAELVNSFGYKPTPVTEINEEKERKIRSRRLMYRIGVAAVCSMNIMMLSVSLYQGDVTGIEHKYRTLLTWVSILLGIPVMAYSATPLYKTALGGLRGGVLHIDLPIVIAIWAGFITSVISAISGGSVIYIDSISAVVFLLLSGRAIQESSIRRVSELSTVLGTILPQTARRKGEKNLIFSQLLKQDEIVLAQSGDSIPADGEVVSGEGLINTAILTGESNPTKISKGDPVFAGTRLIYGEIEIKVKTVGTSSRIGKIIKSLSLAQKPKISLFLDKCSRAFTIVSLALAAVTAIVWHNSGIVTTLDRTLAVLLVGCPCVLAFATPLTFTLNMMNAARRGIFIKNGDAIEKMSHIKRIAFDKTGTLTSGEPQVIKVEILTKSELFNSYELIARLINSLEFGVNHPVASALRTWSAQISTDQAELSERLIIPGKGISALLNSETIYCGSVRWIRELKRFNLDQVANASVVLANREEVLASFLIADQLHANAREIINRLKSESINISIISGDQRNSVLCVAKQLGIKDEDSTSTRSPEEKAEDVAQLNSKELTAFIGDGINDALALRAASVGIGLHGSAENILSVADIYLGRCGIKDLPILLKGCRRTMITVKVNLAFSLFYNLIAVSGAMLGYVGPLQAAILMPLSSLTVIMHTIFSRAFR